MRFEELGRCVRADVAHNVAYSSGTLFCHIQATQNLYAIFHPLFLSLSLLLFLFLGFFSLRPFSNLLFSHSSYVLERIPINSIFPRHIHLLLLSLSSLFSPSLLFIFSSSVSSLPIYLRVPLLLLLLHHLSLDFTFFPLSIFL